MITFVTKDPSRHQVTIGVSTSLEEVHKYCETQQELGFDLETTGVKFFLHNPLLTVIGTPDRCYVVDNTEASGWPLKEVLSFEGFKDKTILGHNLKFDFTFAAYRGVKIPLQCHDTMTTEQCLIKGLDVTWFDGKKKQKPLSVSLAATLLRRTGKRDMDKKVRDEFPYMSFRSAVFADRHVRYAGDDIVSLWRIRDEQLRVATLMEQTLQISLNNAVVPCVALMEARGVLLDQKKWLEAADKSVEIVDRLELELDAILAQHGYKQKPRIKARYYQQNMFEPIPVLVQNKNTGNLNYNSPTQLKKVFNALGWEIPTDQKGKETFGKDEIDRFILNHFDAPSREFLRTFKELKISLKRLSSFGAEFLKKLNPNQGTVHTSYNTNKTATGRFSSEDPNLQQIPADKIYRECFIARPGYKIMSADYSGAELRILASRSKDRKMLTLIDADLHSELATPVWRIIKGDPDLVINKNDYPEERNLNKKVMFSKLYGASVAKTALILNIPQDMAQDCENAMKGVVPEAFQFLDAQGVFAAEHGYLFFNPVVKSRRYFPEIVALDDQGMPYIKDSARYLSDYDIEAIGRKSGNAVMQGTNADMMKIAIVNLTHWIIRNNWPDHILLQVHDELVFELKDDEGMEERAKKYEEIMGKAANKFLEGIKMVTEWKILSHWSK